MQTLDIISVNLWQMLISLLNLLVIFWILKKFLYGPVKKALAERKATLDQEYKAAEEAEKVASHHRKEWEQKIKSADAEAEKILQTATQNAKGRGEKIIAEAEKKAQGILRVAEQDAALERKKADDELRREIVSLSAALTEKMLEREIRPEDHRALISSFIETIGENDE
ncbi:MAG: F0F1 ATP synthase subunit B [Clostridia bacterium]|nr:F0F1 ATP synthase subunit B [Clostridia bacterium]